MGFIIGLLPYLDLFGSRYSLIEGTVTIFQYGAGPNGVMRTLGKFMLGSGATFGYATLYNSILRRDFLLMTLLVIEQSVYVHRQRHPYRRTSQRCLAPSSRAPYDASPPEPAAAHAPINELAIFQCFRKTAVEGYAIRPIPLKVCVQYYLYWP